MRVVLMMLFLAAMGPVMALSGHSVAQSDVALIVHPPWVEQAAILRAVDGVQIGPTSAAFGFLLKSGHPDLTTLARNAGAWWVTGGASFAAICGVKI